jgi:FKBP-type peptidyl-prolyl cis-trans isomerase
MKEGDRKVLVVKPSYAYAHPSCKMDHPPGVPKNQTLRFDLELVAMYPGSEVSHCCCYYGS